MSSKNLFVEDESDKVDESATTQTADIDMLDGEQETNIADVESEQISEDVSRTAKDIDDEVDPIVEEFPINIAGNEEDIHIFQYANKAKLIGKKLAEHPVIAAARYKSKSTLWELDIPLDDNAFFNKHKAEDDWDGVKIQTLRGVGVPNKGQYASFVANDQIYLVPVNTVAQFRPYFKYIDHSIQQTKQDELKQNPSAASQKAQVVTMSVKSVNDPSQNKLAGSLLAHKIAAEEIPTDLTWTETTFEQFKETIIQEAGEHILKPSETKEEYISKLF